MDTHGHAPHRRDTVAGGQPDSSASTAAINQHTRAWPGQPCTSSRPGSIPALSHAHVNARSIHDRSLLQRQSRICTDADRTHTTVFGVHRTRAVRTAGACHARAMRALSTDRRASCGSAAPSECPWTRRWLTLGGCCARRTPGQGSFARPPRRAACSRRRARHARLCSYSSRAAHSVACPESPTSLSATPCR